MGVGGNFEPEVNLVHGKLQVHGRPRPRSRTAARSRARWRSSSRRRRASDVSFIEGGDPQAGRAMEHRAGPGGGIRPASAKTAARRCADVRSRRRAGDRDRDAFRAAPARGRRRRGVVRDVDLVATGRRSSSRADFADDDRGRWLRRCHRAGAAPRAHGCATAHACRAASTARGRRGRGRALRADVPGPACARPRRRGDRGAADALIEFTGPNDSNTGSPPDTRTSDSSSTTTSRSTRRRCRSRTRIRCARSNFRTPRLDLDSLYGSGPADQPYLYEWTPTADRGVKLLVELRARSAPASASRRTTCRATSQGRALIGDPRNDENLIVVATAPAVRALSQQGRRSPPPSRAGRSRRRRAVRGGAADRALALPVDRRPRLPRPHRRRCDMAELVRTPAAAGQPGSGRKFYRWRRRAVHPVRVLRRRLPLRVTAWCARPTPSTRAHDHLAVHLRRGGGPAAAVASRRLPRAPRRRWRSPGITSSRRRPAWPQPSNRLDATFVPAAEAACHATSTAAAARCPCSTCCAPATCGCRRATTSPSACGSSVDIDVMSVEELVRRDRHSPTRCGAAPPLWFYVLREAQARHGGRRLGDVGGRIVAEVLVGLLEGDPSSYLRAAARLAARRARRRRRPTSRWPTSSSSWARRGRRVDAAVAAASGELAYSDRHGAPPRAAPRHARPS